MNVVRLESNPIITPFMDRWMGHNVNGPSLIRAPSWLPNPLGRYYLYFADHRGNYIRLAYADALSGPWRTYEAGSLGLRESFFIEHVASPDAHVDNTAREIRMYVHGLVSKDRTQGTRVATSYDGIHFIVRPDVLGPPYFRVFEWAGETYAWAMGGRFWRSPDGLTPFEQGPECGFPEDTRHGAVLLDEDTLSVFFTCVGDAPERIYRTQVRLDGKWTNWRASEPAEVLRPETVYEGVDLPNEPSKRGPVDEPAHQLRDPAVFSENGQVYLLYAVAGESGIAAARLERP